MNAEHIDLLVIGGGINGVGVARDAAGRGLQVVLCEQADLASATSSASSKLIHGGLRYLEYFEFRLVRESLSERETLLRIAPHIVSPLRFILPHNKTMRPAWLVRMGLFLYDHLSRRRILDPSRRLNLRRHEAGVPLLEQYRTAFAYSDCWVDDARLVVLTALDAARKGATILTRTRFVSGRRVDGAWEATLEDVRTAERRTLRARAVVNVAGPWADTVLGTRLGIAGGRHLRLVKGSHIVVPARHWDHYAYLLQNKDDRVVFMIPFLHKYSMIGTTDVDFTGDPASVHIDDDEVAYLCDAANIYLSEPVTPKEVVWTFAGVRPLVDDSTGSASAVTRDYELTLDDGEGQAPALTVYGGKLTTYRRLAERVLEKLAPTFAGLGPAWTHRQPLPGGDLPHRNPSAFRTEVQRQRNWLPNDLVKRYTAAYGTRVNDLLGEARSLDDLGHHFGGGLYQREVEFLRDEEWAFTAEDILWRRTKLGLALSPEQAGALEAWLTEHPSSAGDASGSLESGSGTEAGVPRAVQDLRPH